MKTDTIAAIATAMTNSGIGIIRISGDEAILVADRILELKGSPSGDTAISSETHVPLKDNKERSKKLADCPSHTLHYGFVKDGSHIVDEVIVLLMKAPKSYTREDTVEIDCHGGILVMNRILELVLQNGARPAEPGEFTKRAFLNGRMDLAQAESVIDLINAKNDFALQASIDQLKGSLSDVIRRIRGEILHEIAFIESAIDDPEHYQLEEYGDQLLKKLDVILEEISNLLKNAEKGAVLKEGINTVIVGKPNSGKSSLMNALAGKERAIVTEIAGTTRDIIEEQIRLHRISLNVIDTAGIRSTEDIVEKIGVDKAKEYLEQADLALYLVDASEDLSEDDYEIIELLLHRNVIVLLNKSDLPSKVKEKDIYSRLNKPILSVSAKYNQGMDELENKIEEMFFHGKIQMNDEIYITNSRHKYLLLEAKNSLSLVKQSIADKMPEDFYSIDLMNAYEALGQMIGEAVEDDLVNEIFRKFCMGK